MDIKGIRQSADIASQMLDKFGNRVGPALQKAIDIHFSLEVEQNGELSVEFLQGLFSGLFFAQDWLLRTSGPAAPSVDLVSQLTLEAARKYLEQVEKQVKKV